MSLGNFFDQFTVLTDAPNAIPKLRNLILQTATQGKLVAQDPSDEPASVLLDQLANGNSNNARSRKGRFSIDQTAFPYEVPSSWQWTTLAQVGHEWGQKKPDVEFTYVDVAAIDNERGLITDAVKRLKPADAPSRARKIIKPGTLIYSTVRPYLLNIAIVEKEYSPEPIASTAFAVIHPFPGISAKYLFYYLRSTTFIDFVESQMQGVAYPAINDEKLFSAPLPLPPSQEQERIVAKVDELLELCDEVEEQQQAKSESRVRLNNAALAPLNKADSLAPAEFEQAVVRLGNNFDTLYDSVDTIRKLRSTILQLAVQGKLVPQNLYDEPASTVLEKVRFEAAQLLTKREIKKTEASPPICQDEIEHTIPETWCWARLSDLCQLITDGTHQTPKYTETGRIFLSAQNVKPFRFKPNIHRYVSEEDYQGYIKNRKPVFEDILLTRVGAGIGEAAVIDSHIEFAFYVSIALIRPFKKNIDPYYLMIWLNSPSGTQKSISNTYGKGMSQGNLNLGLIRKFVVPIPPLAEQKCIVAKVNRLMALCDELEAKLRQAEVDSGKLMNAAVQHMLTTVSQKSAINSELE